MAKKSSDPWWSTDQQEWLARKLAELRGLNPDRPTSVLNGVSYNVSPMWQNFWLLAGATLEVAGD